MPNTVACAQTGLWKSYGAVPAFNCELGGSTSTDQISAVNAVFAVGLVALVFIWAKRKVYELLISNPRTE